MPRPSVFPRVPGAKKEPRSNLPSLRAAEKRSGGAIQQGPSPELAAALSAQRAAFQLSPSTPSGEGAAKGGAAGGPDGKRSKPRAAGRTKPCGVTGAASARDFPALTVRGVRAAESPSRHPNRSAREDRRHLPGPASGCSAPQGPRTVLLAQDLWGITRWKQNPRLPGKRYSAPVVYKPGRTIPLLAPFSLKEFGSIQSALPKVM